MKRFKFNGVLEIPEDTFIGEYGECPGTLFYFAFKHGDGQGNFFVRLVGDPTVEDYEETE